MTTISVAMATYNGARYLQEQLDSFVEQTRPPDELVVSDDGSTDETREILRAFQESAPFPVRIFSPSARLGVRGNFSNALEACEGDYVFLSDQDDVWFDRKIEIMLQAGAERRDAHLFLCDARLANEDLTQLGETKLEHSRHVQLNPEAHHLMGCCMMLTRDFLHLATPIPPVPQNHDDWLFLVGTLIDAVVVLEEPLQLSRRHGANESEHPLATPMRSPYRRLLAERTGPDARQVYGSRRALAAAAYRRLKDCPEELSQVTARDREAALMLARERLATAERREGLLSKSRLGRLPAVMRMLVSQEYRHFAGWRSAVADVVAAKSE